jgi:SPP1 gp7 family putative phage head morphogenesis protein
VIDYAGLSDTIYARLVDEIGVHVTGILESTREDIEREVKQGIDEGLGAAELGDRIEEATAFNELRAETIARTETATLLNRAATESYREFGITHVTVIDGDDDPECAEANGQVWTLDEAAENPIQHPNCVRDFAPFLGEVQEREAEPTPEEEAAPAEGAPPISEQAQSEAEQFTEEQRQAEYESWATYRQEFDGLAEKPTMEEFQAATTENLQKLAESGEIRIRVGDSETLGQIIDDGRFKTQFETETSSGKLDPDLRTDVEKFYFGYSENTAPGERPIYGYLGGDGDIRGVDQYGKIVVELSPDVRERTTVTFNDSLDGYRWNPAIADSTAENGHPPGTSLVPQPLDDVTWRAAPPIDPEVQRGAADWGSLHEVPGYPEVQIHDGVSTDDIERVVFTDYNPPSPAIIEKLDQAGIAWTHDRDFVKYRR